MGKMVNAEEQERVMREQEREEKSDFMRYSDDYEQFLAGKFGDADDLTAEEMEAIANNPYPQDREENEYRYLSPAWLDEISRGLTKGAVKHPGETWRQIPCDEHLSRALRHINLYRMGDRKEPHLVNASMRLMMAFCTETTEIDREAWEKLMREKGCG